MFGDGAPQETAAATTSSGPSTSSSDRGRIRCRATPRRKRRGAARRLRKGPSSGLLERPPTFLPSNPAPGRPSFCAVSAMPRFNPRSPPIRGPAPSLPRGWPGGGVVGLAASIGRRTPEERSSPRAGPSAAEENEEKEDRLGIRLPPHARSGPGSSRYKGVAALELLVERLRRPRIAPVARLDQQPVQRDSWPGSAWRAFWKKATARCEIHPSCDEPLPESERRFRSAGACTRPFS